MERGGYVYILTNRNNTVLYTGVTSNLVERLYFHKTKQDLKSFTAKYNVNRLVYYRGFQFIVDAIKEEKRIKAGSRNKKVQLINSLNPDWNDLIGQFN